jgi:hypothetical protein
VVPEYECALALIGGSKDSFKLTVSILDEVILSPLKINDLQYQIEKYISRH